MTKKLLAAAATAAAAALLVGIWSNSRSQPKAPRPTAQVESDAERALRENVNALGTRVLMLEANQVLGQGAATERREPPRAPAPAPTQEVRSPTVPIPGQVAPEVAAAEAKVFNDFYATLDAKRLAEAPDRKWATTVERGAAVALTEDPPVPGTALRKVECGATLCRVETTHESEIARRVYMTLFPARMGSELEHGSIFAPVDELRTVGYFGRKGFPMPSVPQPQGTGENEGLEEGSGG